MQRKALAPFFFLLFLWYFRVALQRESVLFDFLSLNLDLSETYLHFIRSFEIRK
jgi:hypothetical protein